VKASLLQLVDQEPHSLATIEVEHEGDILEHKPAGAAVSTIQKPKNVTNQSRVVAANSSSSPRLAQVLTGKPGRQDLGIADGLQASNVRCKRYVRELLL